jgi:L-cysteine desulfhydrase
VALAAVTKTYNPNTFVLVDGAHALGQIPHLSIRKLSNIDAYLSNGHKWLYSPKGSAFLWVNQSVVTDLFPQPTVISSENNISSAGGGTTAVVSLAGRYEYVSTS